MKLLFKSVSDVTLMRVKRVTKSSCERAGRVWRKGFKAKGRKRVPAMCVKKSRRKRSRRR